MPSKYTSGAQEFRIQPGHTVQHNADGTATHTVTWRGPVFKLNVFRETVPLNSPVFSSLTLMRAPSEIREVGPYVRVTATYGGTSDELRVNYNPDLDDESPDVPFSSTTANFQETSTVIKINGDDEFVGTAEFEVYYRHPINSFSYTSKTKPTAFRYGPRSGIGNETDPTILSVQRLSDWSVNYGFGSVNAAAQDPYPDESNVSLIKDRFQDQWESKIVKIGFERMERGGIWHTTETWAKQITQDVDDEG